MAVYKKTYRPYDGALTPSWSRFLVMTRYAFEDLHRSRFLTIFYIATFIYPLICALLIYVQHNASVLNLVGARNANNLISINVTVLHVAAGLAEHAGAVPGRVHRPRAGVARPSQQRAAALPGAAVLARRIRARQDVGAGGPALVHDVGARPAAVRAAGLPGRLEVDAGPHALRRRHVRGRLDLDSDPFAVGAGALRLGEVEARRGRPDVRRVLRGGADSAPPSTPSSAPIGGPCSTSAT